MTRRIASATLLALSLGVSALAQQPTSSIDDLKLVLKRSDDIRIVDIHGKKAKGRVESITDSVVLFKTDSNEPAVTDRKSTRLNSSHRT